MVDVALSVGRLLLAFVLVFLNGFFVAAEFAYVRIRATAVDALVEEGRSGAVLLQDAMDNLDDYLAVTQLGITISSLGLGWIGEPAVAALLEPVLSPILPGGLIHLVSFAVGFSIITFLHVVFGELAPKTIAIAQAERVALIVARPMKFFYYVFIPGLVVFNGTANFFTRLIGIPPASENEEVLTEEEILAVLSTAGRKGNIEMEEVELIERVFDFDELSVQAVMVPRPDVITISADAPLPAVRSRIIEEGHTRYPVIDPDTDDQIEGFLDVKDVLRVTHENPDADALTAGDVAREMLVYPETGSVTDLLEQIQRERKQMVAIVDEWGAFEGIVTVEDLVEELVGDIRDDFDAATNEPSIDRRADGTYVVDGGFTVSRLNETLETTFEADGVETVGGLVLSRAGRVPDVGDEFEIDGYEFTVSAVDGARISEVEVRNTGTGPAESTENSSLE
ncbi:hemolysin family protein [Natronosalvus halobius]|uniref:hemolysin family protein n=1 Tax=Natronosalvus halobius TaxID=2953746 RepID=UPI0020A14EF4|nr:hemolysin family protein [Natronosalvus halobius]USZ72514.1 hemolysin family protein [Natronosalvus halobius]